MSTVWAFSSQSFIRTSLCNESPLNNQHANLNLNGARVQFVLMVLILFLEHLHLGCLFFHWCPEADYLIQLVADVCLAVSQLLLQQWDLSCLLAHLRTFRKKNIKRKQWSVAVSVIWAFKNISSTCLLIIRYLLIPCLVMATTMKWMLTWILHHLYAINKY